MKQAAAIIEGIQSQSLALVKAKLRAQIEAQYAARTARAELRIARERTRVARIELEGAMKLLAKAAT